MSHTDRVVVLVDMDCFYCQVEEKLDPELKEKPIAVVQYNAWRGGGIIAVNYPARDKGVTRHMRGDEAKQKCPEIVLARVPQVRGKADLTKYRDAGKQVAEVLQTFTNLLERASVDEAYLDITEEVKKRLQNGLDQITIDKLLNTFVVGCNTEDFIASLKDHTEFSETNVMLAIGGIITEEIRAEIFKRTGYKCSAGIAHNKILAKLVCGLHKPNKQTILPQNAISELYENLPIKKIKSLGGKFGSALAEELQISYMGELLKFSEKELIKKFDEKNGKWLYNIARGIDMEPVTVRLVSKSIGCCKRFPGKTSLRTAEEVEHWINELASEISERLEKDLEENNRRAKQMVVSFTQEANDRDLSSSRTHPLHSYEQPKIARSALDVIRRFCLRADGSYCITFLGLSIGNFQDLKNSVDISSLFKNMNQKDRVSKDSHKVPEPDNLASSFPNNSENNKLPSKDTALLKDDCCGTMETLEEVAKASKGKTSFLQVWATKCNDQVPKNLLPPLTPPIKQEPDKLPNLEDRLESDNSSNKNLFNQLLNTNSENNMDVKNIEVDEKDLTGDVNPKSNSPVIKSFFLNYFMTEGKHLLRQKSNVIESQVKQDHQIKVKDTVSHKRQREKFSNVQLMLNSDKDVCPECSKRIPSSEYASHMDYHFALKMVKDEAHLYKAQKHCVEKDDSKHKHNLKRGREEPKEPGRILTLLHKNHELDEENSEFCAQCNKRVKLCELARHFDEHDTEKISSSKSENSSDKNHSEVPTISEIKSSNRISEGAQLTRTQIKLPSQWEPGDFVKTEHPLEDEVSSLKIYHENDDIFSDETSSRRNVDFEEQDQEDDGNLSVYSADTEELDEDPKTLIYFEDVFSESDSSQPLIKSQEIERSTHAGQNIDHPQSDYKEPVGGMEGTSKSFFLNYLIDERMTRTETRPDTDEKSRCAEVFPLKSLSETMEMIAEAERINVQETNKENCPECNRKIPSSEFLSHLDYHFALKMVKDEAHLYRNVQAPNESKPNKTNGKKSSQAPKRKLPESKNILTFLQTKSEDLDEINSEMCAECNKRIKLEEASGHADYHAAKKLHSELNSPRKTPEVLVKVMDKKSKSVMNMRTISNFFKA